MIGQPVNPSPCRAHRSDWLALAACAAAYTAVFFWFYPPMIAGIDDELGFTNQAIVWSKGAGSSEGAGFTPPYVLQDMAEHQGKHIGYRHPGRPVTILPFYVLGGLPALYLSGLLIQLAQTWVTARTFTCVNMSPLWAVLILFHPTFALFSRTLMADGQAGLGVSLATLALFWPKAGGYGVGLGLGLAIASRFQVGILVLPFTYCMLKGIPVRHSRVSQAGYVLTIGVCGAALCAFNWIEHGRLLGRYYGEDYISLSYIPRCIPYYGSFLLALWPLMLFAPLLDRSALRPVSNLVVWPFLLMICCYHHYLFSPTFLQTVVVEERLLQPVIPVMVVSYGVALSRWLPRLGLPPGLLRAVAAAGVLGLLAGEVFLFRQHQRHLQEMIDIRDDLYRLVPADSVLSGNSTLGKLIDFRLPGRPVYRWATIDLNNPAPTPRELVVRGSDCYIGIAIKPGAGVPEKVRDAVERFGFEPVPTGNPRLALFRLQGREGIRE